MWLRGLIRPVRFLLYTADIASSVGYAPLVGLHLHMRMIYRFSSIFFERGQQVALQCIRSCSDSSIVDGILLFFIQNDIELFGNFIIPVKFVRNL